MDRWGADQTKIYPAARKEIISSCRQSTIQDNATALVQIFLATCGDWDVDAPRVEFRRAKVCRDSVV